MAVLDVVGASVLSQCGECPHLRCVYGAMCARQLAMSVTAGPLEMGTCLFGGGGAALQLSVTRERVAGGGADRAHICMMLRMRRRAKHSTTRARTDM